MLVRELQELPGVRLQAPTNTIRLEIVRAFNEALKLETAIDAVVRRTLTSYARPIVEGSREWDVMYQKLYEEELAKR
jgi:hypothetical protein